MWKFAAFILISLLGAAAAFLWMRSRRSPTGSFWDVLRNPKSLPDLGQIEADITAAAAEFSGSPDDIAALVDDFLFEAATSRNAWFQKRILAKLGAEAYPRTLELLRDPSMHDRLMQMGQGEFSLPEGPINRLCELYDLDTPPPVEAAPFLEPCFDSNVEEVRKSIALVAGSMASAASIPIFQRAINDEAEYVRSYALMGLQRAISGDRIDQSIQAQFFDLVAAMWPQDTSFNVIKKIPDVLLRLDRDRAVEFLLSDELLTTNFPPVWRILQAFKEHSVDVPRSRLLDLIDKIDHTSPEYPLSRTLGEALALLGTLRNPADLGLLQKLLDHDNEQISDGAVEGLTAFHQLGDRFQDPRYINIADDWDSLTVAERHLVAIVWLNLEINNGGFAQFYFNSSGDIWPESLAGLDAIGASERHALMAATLEKFGDAGPSNDRNRRTEQLSKIVRKMEDPFRTQDDAWFKLKSENLDRLIFKYKLAQIEET